MNRRILAGILTGACAVLLTAGLTAHASSVKTDAEEGSVTMPVIAGAIDHEEKDPDTGNSKPGDSGVGKSSTEPEVIVIYLPERDPEGKKNPQEGKSNAQTGKSDPGNTGRSADKGKSTVAASSKTAAKASSSATSASTGKTAGTGRTASSSTGKSILPQDGKSGADPGSGSQRTSGETDEKAKEIHTGTGAETEDGGRRTLPGFLLWLIPLLILLGILAFLAATGRLTGLWMSITTFLFKNRAFIWHGRLPVAGARFVKIRKKEHASTEPLQEIADRTCSAEEFIQEAEATGYETILPYNTGMVIACPGEDGKKQILRMKADEANLYDFLMDYEITAPVKVTIFNDPAEFECALVFTPKDVADLSTDDAEGDGFHRLIDRVKRDEEEKVAAEESRDQKEMQAREHLQDINEQLRDSMRPEEVQAEETKTDPELQRARIRALKEKERDEQKQASRDLKQREKHTEIKNAEEQEEIHDDEGSGGTEESCG